MSTAVMGLCWPLQLPPVAKSVLMSLADNSNDHGECWPSIPTICKRTCCSRSAVISAVKWLEENKIVRIDRGASKSNRYVISPQSFTGDVSGDYHYVYCITHKPTGSFYIGLRSSHAQPEKDDYFGSGKACAWLESVRGECHKQILSTFDARSEAAAFETDLLKKHAADPLCLNKRISTPAQSVANAPRLLLDGSPNEQFARRTVREEDVEQCAKSTQQCGTRTESVRQKNPNRKEPSRTVIKKDIRADFDFTNWPEQPSEQVLADWLALRKRKRADVSATVIREMGKQLHLAQAKGYSVDDALGQCVMRGWQGLKADWLDDNRGSHETATRIGNRKLSAVERVEAAVAERRRERQRAEPIQGEIV